MPEQFIIIPGRTSRQETALNQGKYTDEYLDEIGTLQINVLDMQRLGLTEGDRVRLWNEIGDVTVPCKTAPREELPSGLLFISYGDVSSRLMGGETHFSGMPDSKGIDVYLEKVI